MWYTINKIYIAILVLSIVIMILKVISEILKEKVKNKVPGYTLAFLLTLVASIVITVFVLSNIENLNYLLSEKYWRWYNIIGYLVSFIVFIYLLLENTTDSKYNTGNVIFTLSFLGIYFGLLLFFYQKDVLINETVKLINIYILFSGFAIIIATISTLVSERKK